MTQQQTRINVDIIIVLLVIREIASGLKIMERLSLYAVVFLLTLASLICANLEVTDGSGKIDLIGSGEYTRIYASVFFYIQ